MTASSLALLPGTIAGLSLAAAQFWDLPVSSITELTDRLR